MIKSSENGDQRQAPGVSVDGFNDTPKVENKTPEPSSTEGPKLYSMEDVEAVIRSKMDELRYEKKSKEFNPKDLTQALVEVITRDKQMGGEKTLLREEELDPTDLLDESAVFWSYGHSFSIHSEARNGHNILPPFGKPIRFEHSWTDFKGSGRDKTVLKVCVFKTDSKKVSEWIRRSPLFKNRIFENIKSVANIDMYFANKLAEAASTISGLEPQEVLRRAQNRNIEITGNFDDIRNKLIQDLAISEYEKIRKVNIDAAAPKDLSADSIVKRGKAVY